MTKAKKARFSGTYIWIREKRKVYILEMIHYLVLRVQDIFKESGDDSKEDPPVPIPNTEVKLFNVDDTWWVTAWESR